MARLLTPETSAGFMAAFEYPTYEYNNANSHKGKIDGSRIVPPPEGYTERVRHASMEDHFGKYMTDVEEEHKDLPDDKLRENPPFSGGKRNARWLDTQRLRGLS